jgi:retron-type reverse transcriptase
MKTYSDLYDQLCSFENLELAFKKARKRKTQKDYVIEFEAYLKENLVNLQFELRTFTYRPRPIKTFVVRDPKTRKIGASDFRDRVVHHALINVIAPLFEPSFIFDSFANRKGKGTHAAIKRFEKFMGSVSFNHQKPNWGGSRFWVLCCRFLITTLLWAMP